MVDHSAASPSRSGSGMVSLATAPRVSLAWLALLLAPATSAYPQWTEPELLGPNVNGPSDNNFPFVTADGQRLYLSAAIGIANEDIYVCTWDSALGDWGSRVALGPEVNTTARELSPCQSPDGQYLWFIRYAGGYDVFYCIWDTTAGKWSTAVNAGPQFNTACTEWSVSISADGKRMIVNTAVRPGELTCGSSNIFWVSYWSDSAGWWDSLRYMGDHLNQGLGNRVACMSLDTTRIWIASGTGFTGVPKFGSASDLYYVLNRSFAWDSIYNLGMPPNSYYSEEAISVTADGSTIYFASRRDTVVRLPRIYRTRMVTSGIRADTSRMTPVLCVESLVPNPFNSQTSLALTLTSRSAVSVQIHNVLGRIVCSLHEGTLGPGRHRFTWDASGRPSGVYFIRIATSKEAIIRKGLHMK